MQLLAAILFYIVFIQLFIVLSFYLWRTIYDFFRSQREEKDVLHIQPTNTSVGTKNDHKTRTITTQHSATVTEKEEV